MSTAAIQQIDISSFLEACEKGFPDYTTTTGHKLFPQVIDGEWSKACVWCGAVPAQKCNEEVFICSHGHWKAFVTLPEYVAWGEQAQAADIAYSHALVEWREAGKALGAQHKALTQKEEQLQFAIGDWMVTGEDRGYIASHSHCNYPEAERVTGYSLSSLRNFAYVARHVPASIRMDAVSFGIHQLVAPLKNIEDQKRILQKAAAENLSVAKVRELVKNLPSTIVPKTKDEHDLANGRSPFGSLNAEIKKVGPDIVIASQRLNKWWERVGPMTHKEEEALQLMLPRLSNRAKTAEHIREAATRLMALADRVESYQLAPPEPKPVQEEVAA